MTIKIAQTGAENCQRTFIPLSFVLGIREFTSIVFSPGPLFGTSYPGENPMTRGGGYPRQFLAGMDWRFLIADYLVSKSTPRVAATCRTLVKAEAAAGGAEGQPLQEYSS